MRLCLAPGCRTIVRSGRCTPCKQRMKQQHGSDDPRYHTQRWRRYSQQRLAQHPWCAQCPPMSTLGAVTDHILPVWSHPERFWDETNHQTLCHACNRAKARREEPTGAGGGV
jgi:5-methylcytosine-specific restriction protein A